MAAIILGGLSSENTVARRLAAKIVSDSFCIFNKRADFPYTN